MSVIFWAPQLKRVSDKIRINPEDKQEEEKTADILTVLTQLRNNFMESNNLLFYYL